MAPTAIERRGDHDDRWLDEHLHVWAEAGLISPQQVSAVHDFEAVHQPAPVTRRLGPVAEAGAFIGTVLAMIGGAVGLGPQWGDIDLALRLVIAAAIAAVGFLGGRWLVSLDEPGTLRLGGFLWVLGTSGVALAAGTIAYEIEGDSPWIAVAIGVPVAVIGAALWRNRDRPLQLLTTGAGLALATGGLMAVADLDPWLAFAPAWIGGGLLGLATLRTEVRPRAVALSVAGIAMIGGAFAWCDLSVRIGAGIALAVAALVIVLALRLEETLPLIVGAVGSFMAVQTLVQTTFHGPAGGAALALAGLAMVALVVMRARRPRHERTA